MICIRLKKAIKYLVAENQSIFVEGRSMMHNVLICHDLLRHYNRRTSPRCLLKIDLWKVYDMVNWEFLNEALEGFGFPRKFRYLIMTCVSSTKFFVKINEESHGFFWRNERSATRRYYVSSSVCSCDGISLKDIEDSKQITWLWISSYVQADQTYTLFFQMIWCFSAKVIWAQ